MTREFWKSAGLHLLRTGSQGWLEVTPEFLQAYYTRPEMHPIETSCAAEIDLHEALMADPFMEVPPSRLAALADQDAADNYRHVLVLRNVLRDATDPMRLRAAEIFFREQTVSTEGDRVMLADTEIVDMHARAGRETGLGQLLADSGTPLETVELDILDEDNAAIYWARSDRFDTVVDFRFEQPAPDAFARVIEAWLRHLVGIDVHVEPRPRIDDPDWRWHIGLDAEATRILNALYQGAPLGPDELRQIVGLFRMRIEDGAPVIERVRGRPINLALAMTAGGRVKMKPQNLIANLPLAPPG
jgi:hypothetical protein